MENKVLWAKKGKQPGQQMYKIYDRGLTSFHKESTIWGSTTKVDTSHEGHKRQITETQWPDMKDGRFNSLLKHGCHTTSREPGRNKCLPRARGSRLCWGSVEGANFAQYFSIQQLHLRTYPTDMLTKLQKWKKLLTHNLVVTEWAAHRCQYSEISQTRCHKKEQHTMHVTPMLGNTPTWEGCTWNCRQGPSSETRSVDTEWGGSDAALYTFLFIWMQN